MKLIEDLGMKPVGKQGYKARYGLYECPMCNKHFECLCTDVRKGSSTKCRSCAARINADIQIAKAASSFAIKAMEVHGDTYDYSKVHYVDNNTKVLIICHTHGGFMQAPSAHKQGHGCPSCAGTQRGDNSSFIEEALSVQGVKYNYMLVDYINNTTKVKIICDIHGVFEQTPKKHKQGHGCPSCAVHGFNKEKPAIVYYLKVHYNGTTVYKIGITNRSVEERFSSEDLSKISIVKTWDYLIGAEAYDHEQQILNQYKDFKYTGEPLLSSGNTELFTIDVLAMDT